MPHIDSGALGIGLVVQSTAVGMGASNLGTDQLNGVNRIIATDNDDVFIGLNTGFNEVRPRIGNDDIDGGGGGTNRLDYRSVNGDITVDLAAAPGGAPTLRDNATNFTGQATYTVDTILYTDRLLDIPRQRLPELYAHLGRQLSKCREPRRERSSS